MWIRNTVSLLAVAVAMTGLAQAQGADTKSEKSDDAIVVTGSHVRSLEQFTPTGSRLGLTTRETPASLDIITAGQMEARGFLSVEQAADSLPGVISGGSPGDPSSFSMRGFSGDQISILHNGLYIGPSNMTNRPENTFNLESVEILKGPASVLYGQGAVGGVVNVTNKSPSFGAPTYNFLIDAGSFGSTAFGFGGGAKLSDTVAFRADISRTASDGYIHNSPSDSLNATASIVWKPTDTLRIQAVIDYLEDDPSKYFGTPLVPTSFATDPLKGVVSTPGYTIDSPMRYTNYNVADAKIHSQQYWPQIFLKWTPTDKITVENFAYYLEAKREWIDSETYSFDTATNLIDRDRFFVFHHQRTIGDQGSVKIKDTYWGFDNTFIVGFDYSHLNFLRQRGFPDGDSVDPFNPNPGQFGAIVPRNSPTAWDDFAVFFEDVVSLTPKLKLVTGGRYERLDLVRDNYGPTGAFQASTSFSASYNPGNFRVGLVYDLTPDITPYVSFTTADDPVGNNVFLVNASENFKLSHSQQAEAGVKLSAPDKRYDFTLAVYSIERQNIATQIDVEGDLSNVGSQKSKGVEASGDIKLLDNWSISANAAYTDATYGTFVDPSYGINDSGNEPANTPKFISNLWTSVRNVGGVPLELGAGVKYVGERYADNANVIKLDDYALLNLYAAYQISPNVTITARINNALDKAYANWGDVNYPSELLLGAPRSFEVSVVGHF